MTEQEQRGFIVTYSKTWLRTPYISNAMIKGPRGGVDCAMFLVDVYAEAQIIPKEFDPRPYPPQWHVHQDEERYLNFVLQFSHEIFEDPKPGDVALFQVGRLWSHGAIVVGWPEIIHARGPCPVMFDDVEMNSLGKHALKYAPRRFFSFW